MFQSSGRCARGFHWPKSSRKLKIRSLARARSSSRRAPPIAASKPFSSIASSSVVVCSWLRDARGPVSSTTRPLSIDSCTLAITRRSPSSATRRSRNSITSGKLCPVSMCITGNGNLPGRNAFSASRSITIESLPPEKSSTGRSRSAATSRMMWIASASSSSRCESVRRTAKALTPLPQAHVSGQRRRRTHGQSPHVLKAAPTSGASRDHLLRQYPEFLELRHHDRRRLFGRAAFGLESQLGVQRLLVGIRDACELEDLACVRLRVEPLGVAALALLERGGDV